jgi:hypothetical protein
MENTIYKIIFHSFRLYFATMRRKASFPTPLFTPLELLVSILSSFLCPWFMNVRSKLECLTLAGISNLL